MALVSKTFSQLITFTRASPATYFNSEGVLTTAVINAPRFDYNPATLAARGLLIEEQRINSIRNNTMQGAVAGTPGTLPTNWVVSGTLGTLTREIVGVGTVNGISYIDIRWSGTTSSVGTGVAFETNGSVAASNGQTWSNSAFIALVGGSLTNISPALQARGVDGANASVQFLNQAITPTGTLTRLSQSGTLSNATIVSINAGVNLVFASGVAIDITLRIGLPQLEQGAFATSVIPTTTTALTRNADVASVNTLTPWFNATEGTLFVEASSFALTDIDNSAVTIANGTSTDFINAAISNVGASNRINSAIVTGGTTQVTGFNTPNNSYTQNGEIYRAALGYKTNDSAWACNISNTLATDATVTIPTGLDRLILGAYYVAGNRLLNGYLRRIAYYPRRLSNAELQAITA